MQTSRQPTTIDAIAEDWVDRLVDLDPTLGTYIGRDNGKLPDYSPDGADELVSQQKRVLAELVAARPQDEVDMVTREDLGSELRLAIAQHQAGEPLRDLNVIESPPQQIRDIFDLMPTETEADWAQVTERLRAVPGALASYRDALKTGSERGLIPALRQVSEVAAQARRVAGTPESPGFFGQLAQRSQGIPPSLSLETAAAAASAASAYQSLAEYLEQDLAPRAGTGDAFGRDRYTLASEAFLGARVDLDETYEWGVEELARMTHEQERVAAEILGESPREGIVADAIVSLERDASRKLVGTDALQRWMQETSDRAVRELGASHFDIPEQIRVLECLIAPTQEGGIYYSGPSDDFSRPGRMWWSVPAGVTEFDTWRELTTVYHEGVPGHHLQIGQAVVNRRLLNTWRRQLAGTSGHAEGWALYAERLMDELGYLNDPADRLGMLDGQRMRAARVVLDIGVHLGKTRPGGGVWDAEYALQFMRSNVNMNDGFVRFEVLRYLGWAGQAPSYKVGQRVWEELRRDSQAAAADQDRAWDAREFHRDALALGGVRLDTLQRSLRGELA